MSAAYETHPLAAAFPPQAPEVYAALVKDVAENGLAAPVVLHEGRVLDGVHRPSRLPRGRRGAGDGGLGPHPPRPGRDRGAARHAGDQSALR